MTNENTISHESAIERPRSWWVLDTNGKAQKVEQERFHWTAVYSDGEILEQFEAHEDPNDGTYHRFSEIEFDKLNEIHIRDTERPDFVFIVRGGAHLQHFMIYRTRRSVVVGADGKNQSEKTIRFAIIGWKDRENGTTSYTYLMPDGAIITADRDIQIQ